MQHVRRRWICVAAVLAGLSCSDGGIAPQSFDPLNASQAAENAFAAITDNQAVQSLKVLGSAMTLSVVGISRSVWPTYSASNPTDIFPAPSLGKTYVYNQQTARYEQSDPPISGAPADGVRFLLYAVEPDLQVIVSPLDPVGHLDLRDTSAPSESSLHLEAVIGGTTVLAYDADGTFTSNPQTLSFGATGFASNGSARIDFDLSQTLSQGNGLAIDYNMTVPGGGLQIRLVASRQDGSSPEATLTVVSGDDLIEIEASGLESVTGSVRFNGALAGTIEGSSDAPVFRAPDGELTPNQLEGMRQLYHFTDELLDQVDDLIGPAYLVFGINL